MSFPLFVPTQTPTREGELQPGLTHTPRSEWPRVSGRGQRPIDFLKPNTEAHNRILNMLIGKMKSSEREMENFYSRWRSLEKRHQAWIDLPRWEEELRKANDEGKPPKALHVTIPYSFSTTMSVATYLLQVFTGRKPHFQVGTYGPHVRSSQKMEVVLQYQSDHGRMIRNFWQWFMDFLIYGLGALQTEWRTETGLRTRPSRRPVLDMMTGEMRIEEFREQQEVVTYEGNTISNIDPYHFYPDPRVPMSQVAERGEFVGWRTFDGKHSLKRAESDGVLKWVDNAATDLSHSGRDLATHSSARDLLSRGIAHPGGGLESVMVGRGYYKVDRMSIDIIPRELGLGDSEKIQKWIFTWLNDSQIVQAEPLRNDHGHHPVVVVEPLSMGYSFGAASMSDYMAPIQDSMSWFLNSHMDNVRKSINDMWIYDPTAIVEKDLKRPEPGKMIRLKNTALGRDIKTIIQQFPATDVTRGHVDDMNTFLEFGQRVSAVSDNMQGIQDPGGRKTATEVRTATEAGASRLSALARIMSAQGFAELTYQMSLNTQQYLTKPFYARIVGPRAALEIPIQPGELVGDYYFPIHDGTLPLDRTALFDIWMQAFQGILTDPALRSTYNILDIFEFMAELGGIKNIKSFRLNPEEDSRVQAQAQQGNVIPFPQERVRSSGSINPTNQNPGRRAAGALS